MGCTHEHRLDLPTWREAVRTSLNTIAAELVVVACGPRGVNIGGEGVRLLGRMCPALRKQALIVARLGQLRPQLAPARSASMSSGARHPHHGPPPAGGDGSRLLGTPACRAAV